ncbi:MAG: hypothetical protein LBR85_03230 [Oscillospiraceae bacterium]|jgi:REP element-mobilizing transposase RayT|nr:hypothetical protein [Oscillospiraceae bacterium]
MKDLPVRKHPRLNNFNYSSKGAYFITFCIKNRHELLGRIVVGRGILDAPHVDLSEYGVNLCNTIDFIHQNNDNVKIHKYVIMPNHVHMIVMVDEDDGGASGKPRPTNAEIPKLISSIKRFTNKQAGFNMWQISYHDHIIRDEEDYQNHWRYIDENPRRWAEDEYYGQDN